MHLHAAHLRESLFLSWQWNEEKIEGHFNPSLPNFFPATVHVRMYTKHGFSGAFCVVHASVALLSDVR
jgi:hypothetical protein